MIKYSVVLLIFSITIMIMLDINLITMRKSEMDDALRTSIYNVLKANSIDKMYPMNATDMRIELIREIASNLNADSTFILDIRNITSEGLIDAQLTSSFHHLNSEEDKRVNRKIMLVEEYDK